MSRRGRPTVSQLATQRDQRGPRRHSSLLRRGSIDLGRRKETERSTAPDRCPVFGFFCFASPPCGDCWPVAAAVARPHEPNHRERPTKAHQKNPAASRLDRSRSERQVETGPRDDGVGRVVCHAAWRPKRLRRRIPYSAISIRRSLVPVRNGVQPRNHAKWSHQTTAAPDLALRDRGLNER